MNTFIGFCVMMDNSSDPGGSVFVYCGTFIIMASIIAASIISPKSVEEPTLSKAATDIKDVLGDAVEQANMKIDDESMGTE
ncbi:MAG: hypothetical protein JEZ07_06865 [Phycisphaerae bacterium]|nr:hypothetical protein [Phycisphaerae bacterium]